jgi:glutaredoxin-related protein
MRSVNIFIVAAVLCGALLFSCKKQDESQIQQPKMDQVAAAPATPQATPAPVSSPALEPAKTPASAAQATPRVSPTPAARKEITAKDVNLDRFAQCLTRKQVTMYGHMLCPHCAEQKEKFGASFKYVHYVECGILGQPMNVQSDTCKEMQIVRYPTWVFADGERIAAVQTMEQLSDKTGCKLP